MSGGNSESPVNYEVTPLSNTGLEGVKMTVQRAHLEVINGVTYMYERKRIFEEMPLIKLKSKKWFLWRATEYRWEYLGYYDTKRDMLREVDK